MRAFDLFRAGVLRGQDRRSRHCRQTLCAVIRLNDLGDPEIEQLRHTIRRDENVGRLQVAVDDEVLVGVGNGRRKPAGKVRAVR